VPSSTSSLPAASPLHGSCPACQRAHLRDCHFLPAQRDVLQRLLLHLLRTSSPATSTSGGEHDGKHANIGATAVQQRGERPAGDAGSAVQRSGSRSCPVHATTCSQLREPGAVLLHHLRGAGAVHAGVDGAVHAGHLGPLHHLAAATAAVHHAPGRPSSAVQPGCGALLLLLLLLRSSTCTPWPGPVGHHCRSSAHLVIHARGPAGSLPPSSSSLLKHRLALRLLLPCSARALRPVQGLVLTDPLRPCRDLQ